MSVQVEALDNAEQMDDDSLKAKTMRIKVNNPVYVRVHVKT